MLRQANLIDNKFIPILYGDINSYSTELNYRELDDQKLASLYVKNRDDYAYNEIVKRFGQKIFRLAIGRASGLSIEPHDEITFGEAARSRT